MGYGMGGHLGLCFQETSGVAFTSSFHWLPILSESLTEGKPPVISEAMRGRFEEGPTFEGVNEIGGEIVAEADPIIMGKFFKAWFGQSSGTLTTSVYVHEFVPRTSDFNSKCAVPPLTAQVYRDAGSAGQYSDLCCNELSIEIAHGAIIKYTGTFIGMGFTKVAKSTPTYLTGSEFTWDQTSIEIAGAAVEDITQMSVKLSNNLEAKGTLDGNKTPNRIKRAGFRTIEISGTMLFLNDTEFDKFRAQTEQRLVVTVTGQAVSSGYNAYLSMDFPSVRYNEFPQNIGGPGQVEVPFTATAKYNSGSGHMAKFSMQNTLTQY
jgi:hypothetical protein